MAETFVDISRLDAADLRRIQREKLLRLWNALQENPFYSTRLAGLNFDPAADPVDRLPFTTRREIEEDQATHPPYGSNLGEPVGLYVRLHQTSGSGGRPLRWLDTPVTWDWWKKCWQDIFRAARLRSPDRIFFPFSFGPFIGFWAAFDAAVDARHLVIPGGGMSTDTRLRIIIEHDVGVICCTPTYALRLAEVARDTGLDLERSSVRTLILAGEPGASITNVRSRIEKAWGARVIDHAGMTEIGAWGYETVDDPGVMVVNELEFIAEVVDPTSGAAVEPGREGELVLTNLGRNASPLVRYRTGDLVKTLPRDDRHPLLRLEGGVLGRVDDMMTVRGVNVFPSAIESVVREFDEIREFQVEIEQGTVQRQLLLRLERDEQAVQQDLEERFIRVFRDRLYIRPEIEWVPAGRLPRPEMKSRRIVRRPAQHDE